MVLELNREQNKKRGSGPKTQYACLAGVAKTGALYLMHIFRDERRKVNLTETRSG